MARSSDPFSATAKEKQKSGLVTRDYSDAWALSISAYPEKRLGTK